ncbi:J domain-containing protein [Azoarcus sp. KH32C]|uniref:J domain-containing protein n=1 Tax=Azoarcus sp. KH32C TaxID=748247 RepID=UPI0012EA265A|nr:J domain-containing protein [Azoarcus sp. KH32C]
MLAFFGQGERRTPEIKRDETTAAAAVVELPPPLVEPEPQVAEPGPAAEPEQQPASKSEELLPELEVLPAESAEIEDEEVPEPATAEAAVAHMPDADLDKLIARAVMLQGQMRDLTVRLAEMQRLVCQFQQSQYVALGTVIEECLMLRAEYYRLRAEQTGAASDREEAGAAAKERDAFHKTVEESSRQASAQLDEEEQDELRRLYRAAVMRCHPDRVGDTDKDAAHESFLSVQEAYRRSDLAALQRLLGELETDSIARQDTTASTSASTDHSARSRVRDLQDQVADLILAIQTLQLDTVYRQARSVDDWEDYFAHVRSRFVDECATLRRRIDALSAGAA